jgi:hypothetical protein
MASLARSERPIAFTRKTIEPLEGSMPGHNSVTTRIQRVFQACICMFSHKYTGIIQNLLPSINYFSVICKAVDNKFWLFQKRTCFQISKNSWLAGKLSV